MKEVKILTIDNRARIVIPQSIRKAIGLKKDSKIMVVADTETKNIEITPLAMAESHRPLKLKITMKDVPGALGKLGTVLGEKEISIMYCEAVVTEKDKLGIITVILQGPEYSYDDLNNILKEKANVMEIEYLPLE